MNDAEELECLRKERENLTGLSTLPVIMGLIFGGLIGWSLCTTFNQEERPVRQTQCIGNQVYWKHPSESFWRKDGGSCATVDKE